MNNIKALITHHEGRRSEKYTDTKGIPTIGIGHNLKAAPPCDIAAGIQLQHGLPSDDSWTDDTIDAQYDHDFAANCGFLATLDWYTQLDANRQAAVCDMAFNLGPAVFAEFTTFISLLKHGYYAQAAADLLRNPKLPTLRYEELAEIIRSGSILPVLLT